MISVHYIFLTIASFLVSRKRTFVIFIAIFLSLITAYIGMEYSRDAQNYINAFYLIEDTDSILTHIAFLEPSFYIVSKYLHLINLDVFFLFFVYAFIALSIKLYVITKYSNFPLLSLLFYFSYFYLLQDCTQIRVSVAVAFLFLSMKYFIDKKPIFGNFMIFISFLFHYSALLLFLINFILSPVINRNRYLFIFLFAIFFYVAGFSITSVISNMSSIIESFSIFNKLILYANKAIESELAISLINMKTILLFTIVLFTLVFEKKLKLNHFEVLSFKLVYSSLIAYILFADLPHLAVRISELFMVPMIFLLPAFFRIFKYKQFILSVVFILIYLYFSYFVYIQKIFNLG